MCSIRHFLLVLACSMQHVCVPCAQESMNQGSEAKAGGDLPSYADDRGPTGVDWTGLEAKHLQCRQYYLLSLFLHKTNFAKQG